MAITPTPLLTLISNCDTAVWSSGAVDAEKMLEGVGCLGLKISATLGVVAKYDQGGVNGVNMSGQHFYVWFMSTSTLNTKALGGLRIYLEDKNGAYKTIYVGGSDNYPGGWQRYCCSAEAVNDGPSSGTYDPTVHRYIGVNFYTTGKSTVVNCFWDFVHYGSGLRITSGAADQITWQNIYDADVVGKYGIVSKVNGIYFLLGELIFGSSALHIDFKDTNQIVMFVDNPKVASTLYKIKVEGYSGGTTNFEVGSKAGTQGYGGIVFKGVQPFLLDLDDANIDILKLYGCTFNNAGDVYLPPNASGREVLNCNFNQCGEVLADTCIFQNCNIVQADDKGLRISSELHNVKNCNFINNPAATHIPTAGTYGYENMRFYNNTKDVRNSGNSAVVIINKTFGTDASTHEETGTPPGTTTIQALITLAMLVKNEAGNGMNGCYAYIDDNDQSPFIMNGQTAYDPVKGDGYISASYTGGSVNPARWRVRKYGYKNFKMLIDIGSSNIELPVTLVVDPQQI